jgi:predicted metal-dependent phosphotriesterase family hydrolase
VLSTEILRNYPHLWDEEQQIADAVARLQALKAGGVDTIVDPTVITEGIGGTAIKAAFLKSAIEAELTPGVERLLVAVAEAHKRTGVPITVHTSPAHRTGWSPTQLDQLTRDSHGRPGECTAPGTSPDLPAGPPLPNGPVLTVPQGRWFPQLPR